MAPISTRNHALGDYAGGALMLAAAELPFVRDRRAAALLRLAGAGTLLASLNTDYELGMWRRLPMPVHLAIDAGTGALMSTAGLMLRRAGAGAGSWLPHTLLGVSELAVAALTERAPADRVSAAPAEGARFAPASGAGAAATAPATPIAPAPIETPGPSVTPPAQPESDIERTERIDAALPDPGVPHTGDELVAREEAAAAAEAAAIGGRVPSETGDPAMDPVYEAGGGEQEGWEAAEADLIENATHGEGGGDPSRDALAGEVEADRSTAVYGEADRLSSTEVVDDPGTGGEDPGEGPGLSADRGPGTAPKQD